MATKRLIDANALEQHIVDSYGYPAVDILHEIATFPTVDAVEVVHGRWKVIELSDDLYGCSACGEWQFIPEEHFAYCPYCGAKMDGDGNG